MLGSLVDYRPFTAYPSRARVSRREYAYIQQPCAGNLHELCVPGSGTITSSVVYIYNQRQPQDECATRLRERERAESYEHKQHDKKKHNTNNKENYVGQTVCQLCVLLFWNSFHWTAAARQRMGNFKFIEFLAFIWTNLLVRAMKTIGASGGGPMLHR